MAGRPYRFVIDPDGVVAKLGRDATGPVPPALAGLVAQESAQRPRIVPNLRVAELADAFGFGFEPWAEPGHVRMLPMASRMHAAAESHARRRVAALASELGLPLDEMSGVVVVDTGTPALAGYLDLIHTDSSLYGAEPYALAGSRGSLILRQTSCIGKYSVASEWDWESTRIPRCLFEISDSFRGEQDGDLEQLFRVRKFRLPEAHLHHADLAGALDMARDVQGYLSSTMRELETDFVLLVSASHETWTTHRKAIATMVADSASWALALVSPPGELCQDGIELDFEYKFLDVDDVPRELATFQVDTRITRAIGLSGPHAELTTMHVVPTGSVERLVYAHLDRVARHESAGHRTLLPCWLTPVAARLIDDPAAPNPGIAALLDEALHRGLPVEVDDRPLPTAEKHVDADRLLVPCTVSADPDGPAGRLLVRDFTDRRVTVHTPDAWLASVDGPGPDQGAPLGSSPWLSLQPRTHRRTATA